MGHGHLVMRTFQLISIILALVICGCAASTHSNTTAPRDAVVERLVAASPLEGHWTHNGFSGEFRGLTFARQNWQENGQTVYTLTGNGQLWCKPKPIDFSISGKLVGRKLMPTLHLPGKKAPGLGTIEIGSNGWPICTVVFSYNGRDYQAPLQLSSAADIDTARQLVLSQNQEETSR